MVQFEDGLRRGWLSLLTNRLADAIQPADIPSVHASGPLPFRVLLLGGGVAVGLGVTRQDLALPGHLARHLASITGRGVDLDIGVRLGMTVTDARAEVDRRNLTRYDAIVLSLGGADALSALPADDWRDRLDRMLAALLHKTSPGARIMVIGAHSSSWSPYLNPLVTRLPARRLDEFNRISRELCWALPRASYLAPIPKRSADETQYCVLDYDRLGRAAAAHLAHRLDRQPPPAVRHATPESRPGGPLPELGLVDLTLDAVIDQVVARTRSAFGVEGAALTVVDGTEVRPRSSRGLHERASSPHSESLHAATASAQGGLAVRNLREDPRFADSPLARRYDMRFYAGYPVHFSGGECVAVLTIFDPRPRTFSAQEMSVLRNHALLIQDAIAQSSPRRHARAPGRRERPVQAEPVRHPAAASARHA